MTNTPPTEGDPARPYNEWSEFEKHMRRIRQGAHSLAQAALRNLLDILKTDLETKYFGTPKWSIEDQIFLENEIEKIRGFMRSEGMLDSLTNEPD